jgi:hypothetical protein
MKRASHPSVHKDMEQRECSCSADGNIKWASHLGKSLAFSQKRSPYAYCMTQSIHWKFVSVQIPAHECSWQLYL